MGTEVYIDHIGIVTLHEVGEQAGLIIFYCLGDTELVERVIAAPKKWCVKGQRKSNAAMEVLKKIASLLTKLSELLKNK